MQRAIDAACNSHAPEGIDRFVSMYLRPGGQAWPARRLMAGWQRRFETPGGLLSIDRFAPRDYLHHMAVSFEAESEGGVTRPTLLAVTNYHCTIKDVRRLTYSPDGMLAWLELLSPAFEPVGVRHALNPPVPRVAGPSGVPVAIIDSGVNYTLPQIALRLARDEHGHALGYDYWDMDARPFDAHPARSPFVIERHGTRIASVVLREAPVATIVPYRYPRPRMARMRTLVEDAASQDVVIVNLSLVSTERKEWLAFEYAASQHPDMLFVAAAGNFGRDLAAWPAYPAAFDLPNLIVATSSTRTGDLAEGANFGASQVDVMVPAVEVRAAGFDGIERAFSGSSYAAARLSALAACLLSANPSWRAPELKRAIVERAERQPRPFHVRFGFLSEGQLRVNESCPGRLVDIEPLQVE
ncbi:MAG: S8 family serine peptidase [Gammaproteobacteria bacterium]